MEIRNLYTFLQVASMENFTQAGHVLGYSQSGVSAQIQQLEDEIGVQLFDRIGRGVTLTQYGKELIPYARQIVSISAEMGNFLKPEAKMNGTLRVGMVESLFDVCFESFMLRYCERFPEMKIDLTVDATATLQELMQKNRLDIACVIDDPLPKSKWICCYERTVKIAAVANIGHSLVGKHGIGLEELSNEKVLLMEDAAPYNVHLRHILASRRIEIEPFLTLQSTGMAARLVMSGDYISFLPDYTVRNLLAQGKLALLDIKEYNQSQAAQIILHKDKVITPQIRGFEEEVKAVLESVLFPQGYIV